MKNFKYLVPIIITAALFTACSKDPEKFVLQNDIAPVVNGHANILVYPNNIDENVTFTWEAAQFTDNGDIEYKIYGISGKGEFLIGETKTLNLNIKKGDFSKLVISKGIPANVESGMKVYVKAFSSNGTEEKSNEIAFSIVTLDETKYILPVLYPISNLVLTSADADKYIDFTWSAATMDNVSEINYNLMAKLADKSVIMSSTDFTSAKIKTETFNDFIINLGAPEGKSTDITFYVEAISSKFGTKILSKDVVANITTYAIPYADGLGVTGNHQGWTPATAPKLPKTTGKGIYKGYLQMYDETGTVVFKFTTKPSWDGPNYGWSSTSEDSPIQTSFEGLSTNPEAKNLRIQSGIYLWNVNTKTGTANAIKMATVGIVGSFAASNWGSDVIMTFDAVEKKWTVSNVVFQAGQEFKIRFQTKAGETSWDYSLGENADNLIISNDNIKIEEAGTYNFMLDLCKTPLSIVYTKQ